MGKNLNRNEGDTGCSFLWRLLLRRNPFIVRNVVQLERKCEGYSIQKQSRKHLLLAVIKIDSIIATVTKREVEEPISMRYLLRQAVSATFSQYLKNVSILSFVPLAEAGFVM